jgi:hypothetical protein
MEPSCITIIYSIFRAFKELISALLLLELRVLDQMDGLGQPLLCSSFSVQRQHAALLWKHD